MYRSGEKVRRARREKTRPVKTASPAVLADLDTQLMLQARDGDREAANMLVRRNFDRISRYITRLVGRDRAAEDLTQDVFLRALTNADRYVPTAKVTTWLYRIATNTVLNHLKRPHQKRQVDENTEGALEPPDHKTTAPDGQLSLDELRARVAQAVRDLPPNQRVALTLFQYEDCSYEQIAAVLDVTVEAVRSLLLRARTTLRRELQGLM